jgi:hypothetical protein
MFQTTNQLCIYTHVKIGVLDLKILCQFYFLTGPGLRNGDAQTEMGQAKAE